MKTKYWLLLTFLIAFILRIYNLGNLPFNFHEDEILSGYVGRFILLNGKDLYNNPWPLLYFNKFGDYYIILPMYIKGLFTFIFGVNEFAVRFPTALIGALGVFPVYYLANWTFKKKAIALLSAFLLAIAPWHIVMSRANAEGVMGGTIFLSGLVLVLLWLDSSDKKLLLASAVLLFITYFIYHPYRILVPIALAPLSLLFIIQKHKRTNYIPLVLLTAMFFAFTFYISTTIWGSGRFEQTSIFSPLSGVSIKIQELIYDEGTNNILLAKIFHNKVIGYGREFIGQYFTYFSFNYLFLQGGKSFAYRVPEQGLFFISFIGLAILSFVYLAKNYQNFKDKPTVRLFYLIYLLLIAALPSALTVLDAPNVHRSVIMSMFLVIFFSCGLYSAWNLKFHKFRLAHIFIVLLAAEFIYFWHQYSHADFFNAIYRNDAQKQVVAYVKDNVSQDTPVIMPVQKTMPLYYLFYTNDFDPKYATQFKLDARIKKIDNITFFDDECPSNKLLKSDIPRSTVIIDSHNCQTDLGAYELVSTITGKNPLLSYHVLKFKNINEIPSLE